MKKREDDVYVKVVVTHNLECEMNEVEEEGQMITSDGALEDVETRTQLEEKDMSNT